MYINNEKATFEIYLESFKLGQGKILDLKLASKATSYFTTAIPLEYTLKTAANQTISDQAQTNKQEKELFRLHQHVVRNSCQYMKLNGNLRRKLTVEERETLTLLKYEIKVQLSPLMDLLGLSPRESGYLLMYCPVMIKVNYSSGV